MDSIRTTVRWADKNAPKKIEQAIQKKIEQILLDVGYIKQDKLQSACDLAKTQKRPLLDTLLESQIIDEIALAHALCRELQFPFLSLEYYSISEELLQRFPKELMAKYHCIPVDELAGNPGMNSLLIYDAISQEMLQELHAKLQKNVSFYIGLKSEVEKVLAKYVTEEERIAHSQIVVPEVHNVTAGWETMFDDADKKVLDELRLKGGDVINTRKQREMESMLNISGLSVSQNAQLRSQALNIQPEIIENVNVVVREEDSSILTPPAQNFANNETVLTQPDNDSGENVEDKKESLENTDNVNSDSQMISDGNAIATDQPFSPNASTPEQNGNVPSSEVSESNDLAENQEDDEQVAGLENRNEESLRLELEKLAAILKKSPANYAAVNRYVEIAVYLKNMPLAIAQLQLFGKGLLQGGDIAGACNCFRYILNLSPNNLIAKQYLAQYTPRT